MTDHLPLERALRYAVGQWDMYQNSISAELYPVDYIPFVAEVAQGFLDAEREHGNAPETT